MGEMAANGMADAFPGAAGRTPAEIERDLAISTLVDLRLLHTSRSASLFRARQIPTQRTVAVKVLHDELSSDVGQRFDRERAITGQLSGHTGIVPLFDTGTTADGEPYLILPFYRRGSLTDLTTRYGPLAWQEATFLLEPVAVTLAEVHGRDLVHRNLKPANVLLTDFLLPRVSDFGMCLPKGQASTPATLVKETAYSPPEVAEPGEADPATDVFGLGATLSGLLSGREPPPPIADLIERSMALDAADRPPNAAAFVTELRRAVSLSQLASEPMRTSGDSTPTLANRFDASAPTTGQAPSSASPDSHGQQPTAADDDSPRNGSEPTASQQAGNERASSEFYLLVLVAIISTGILVMLAAAVLTGN